MNNVDKLNQELLNDKLIQEYLKLKNILETNKDIQTLMSNIKDCQKEMNAHLKNNDLENYKIKKQELLLYKQEFDNIYEIHNYLKIKQDVYDLINHISQIISN